MANLLAYCRVSSDGQRDNTSISTQREGIDRYCDIHGHKLVGFYQDVESAATVEREGFQMALRDLERCDGMIVYRLDRMTRSVYDAERLKRAFMAQNKLLISVCDNTDLITDDGEFLFTIQSAISQLERKRILTRAKAGIDRKRSQGQYYGGMPPYGWASLNGKLVELPHEQRIIEEIRKLYWEEGWPLVQIARLLNDRGVPSKMRKKWSRDTVKRITSGETMLVGKLRASGNVLPPEAWEEFANGKKRISSESTMGA